MTISRRQFVGTGVAAGLGAGLLAACSSTDQTSSASSTTVAAAPDTAPGPATFQQFLDQRGYTAVPAASMITSADFNGGLRFDDDTSRYAPKSYVVQQAARVEDAAKQSTPGTLPLFTIVGLETTTPELANEAATAVLEYLTSTVGLDPTRLRSTTTELSSAFFPLLARFGIGESQLRLRPVDEARQQGSGSGWFAPAGHPGGPAAPSFSIEYVMPDSSELEIAEITHGAGAGTDSAGSRTSGGIGAERVAMARSGAATNWADALPTFTEAIRSESERTGVALPAGFATIAGTTSAPTTTA